MNINGKYIKLVAVAIFITIVSAIATLVIATLSINSSYPNKHEDVPAYIIALGLSFLFSFLRFEELPYTSSNQRIKSTITNFVILALLSLLGLLFSYFLLLRS
jgi:putative flippase GtrA